MKRHKLLAAWVLPPAALYCNRRSIIRGRHAMRALAVIAAVGLCGCAATSRPPRVMLVDPQRLPLEVLPGTLAWCKVPPDQEVPRRREPAVPLAVVVYAPEGVFVVAGADSLPPSAECIENDLRAIRLVPTADPIVGTIATVTHTVAVAGVSMEVLTTAETDYFLIPAAHLERAVGALRRAGHSVRELREE